MIAVRIGYVEIDLLERSKRLDAIWRPAQKLWEMRRLDANIIHWPREVVAGLEVTRRFKPCPP